MINMITKVISYSGILGLSLWGSHEYFSGSDVALLSLFILGAFVYELLAHARVGQTCAFRACCFKATAPKAILYLLVVAVLATSGYYLISKAMEVRRSNQTQEAIEHRLTSAMNDASSMVGLATNDKQLVVAISGGLLHKIGYSRDEVLNKPVTNLIPSFDLCEAKRDVTLIRGRGHDGWMIRENRLMQFRRKDGSEATVEMTIIGCRLSTDRIVERDVLFLMLAEEVQR